MGSAVTFLILYRLARRENIVKFYFDGIAKIWVAALVMFLTVFISMHLLVRIYGYNVEIMGILIVAGAVFFVLITRVMKIFNEEQKEYILGMFPESMGYLKKILRMLVLS